MQLLASTAGAYDVGPFSQLSKISAVRCSIIDQKVSEYYCTVLGLDLVHVPVFE